MNENKLQSPIILVDPTFKERNALASLGYSTLKKFQQSASEFLRNPSSEYFELKPIEIDKMKKIALKRKGEFIHLNIKTDRQIGDIAGTKLSKFSKVLEREVGKYFKIIIHEFEYSMEDYADLYLVLVSKKQFTRIGPPLHMKKHVRSFKKQHRKTYEKNKFIHAKIEIKFTAKAFLDVWNKDNKKIKDEMSITEMTLVF